jgi:hypothetical protein
VGEQGIHGYKTMDDLIWSVRGEPERLVGRRQMTECDGVVIGTVALSGVIWEHAKGYRAQFARPTSFISSYGKRSEEALAELRASFLIYESILSADVNPVATVTSRPSIFFVHRGGRAGRIDVLQVEDKCWARTSMKTTDG